MKTCNNCLRSNPDDFNHCRYCGADIRYAEPVKRPFWKRLPAWVLVLLIVGGLIGIWFLLVGSFLAISTIEGVASMVLLILGAIGFGVVPLRAPDGDNNVFRAIGLAFFALMGASLDQTGNTLYNKPVEYFLCPAGTGLDREEIISNPLPGTTYVTQDFTCWDKSTGKPVMTLNPFKILGIRFVEYFILGYILLGLRFVFWRIKNNS